jgi:hypothetical protein
MKKSAGKNCKGVAETNSYGSTGPNFKLHIHRNVKFSMKLNKRSSMNQRDLYQTTLGVNCQNIDFLGFVDRCYSIYILRTALVSGSCNDRIISLGMSKEALSEFTQSVREHMKFVFLITIS